MHLKTGQTPARGSEQALRQRLGVAKPAGRGEKPSLRHRVLDTIKTLAWVAPLTILLWVYAEREQVSQREVEARITVRSTDPAGRIITVKGEQTVKLELEGARKSLDAVSDRLAEGKTALTVLVGEEPGWDGDISLAERLNKDELLTQHVVDVVRARPNSLHVRVEAKGARQLPVRARAGDVIVASPLFEPAQVTVVGPKDLLEYLPPERAFVEADLSKFADKKPGQYEEEVPLAVTFPGANITLEPKTVRAKVEIRPQATKVLQAVPVYVKIPMPALDNQKYYSVSCPPTLANVEVTGPEKLLEDLGKRIPCSVTVELKDADVTSLADVVVHLKADDYQMPKEVIVLKPERDITVKITERGG